MQLSKRNIPFLFLLIIIIITFIFFWASLNSQTTKEDEKVLLQNQLIFHPTNSPIAVLIPNLLDSNFDLKTKAGYWFVLFHSPSCPHCRAFQSTWTTVATNFYNKQDFVNIASVNVQTNRGLLQFLIKFNFNFKLFFKMDHF
eukprot:TRINITY_DN2394_c1_g1_i2.p1 TRINITY_DN2394_c1_g1~~TRINITY_DN2394_c1_g1_i2.p1  ORF type:complete len:142 (-),score=38.06 TRINITY_DN2394_c1_g1_i2:273-698(-)